MLLISSVTIASSTCLLMRQYVGEIKDASEQEINELINSSVVVEKEVNSEGKKTKKHIGTAALIHENGFFLTAAHVLHAGLPDPKFELKTGVAVPGVTIRSFASDKESNVKFVAMGEAGFDLESSPNDWALLQADPISSIESFGSIAVKIRHSMLESIESDGFFPALNLDRDQFGRAKYEGKYKDELYGTVLPGQSGSLLIDKLGWGHGIVSAFQWENSHGKLTRRQLRELLEKSTHFGFARIEASDGWWKKIDISGTNLQKQINSLKDPNKVNSTLKEILDDNIGLIEYLHILEAISSLDWTKLSEQDRTVNHLFHMKMAIRLCLPDKLTNEIADRFRAGESIESGRIAFRNSKKSHPGTENHLENLLAAQISLKRGIKNLEDQYGTADANYKYRSNVSLDLAQVNNQLYVTYGSIEARDFAKRNFLFASGINPNNKRNASVGAELAAARGQWEASAFFRITEGSKIESEEFGNIRYLAQKDAIAGGSWGPSVLGHFKKNEKKYIVAPPTNDKTTETTGIDEGKWLGTMGASVLPEELLPSAEGWM